MPAAWIVSSREQSGGVQRWQTPLTAHDPGEWVKRFRRTTYAGSPFDSQAFVERVQHTKRTAETLIARNHLDSVAEPTLL